MYSYSLCAAFLEDAGLGGREGERGSRDEGRGWRGLNGGGVGCGWVWREKKKKKESLAMKNESRGSSGVLLDKDSSSSGYRAASYRSLAPRRERLADQQPDCLCLRISRNLHSRQDLYDFNFSKQYLLCVDLLSPT